MYKELDSGVTGEWMPGNAGNLAFLSARPHVYKSALELSAFAKVGALVARGQMHCAPTMLAGQLDTGSYLFWGNYEPVSLLVFRFLLLVFL